MWFKATDSKQTPRYDSCSFADLLCDLGRVLNLPASVSPPEMGNHTRLRRCLKILMAKHVKPVGLGLV